MIMNFKKRMRCINVICVADRRSFYKVLTVQRRMGVYLDFVSFSSLPITLQL
jgi:hypothetical protein